MRRHGSREVDDLPDGDIDIPFMEEDDPDIDIPDIDDDEELAAEDAAAGMTATTDGIRITANSAPRAPRGLTARNLAAGVGWSAGSGTRGNTDNPINAMSGPLLGSVPPKVSNSPTPSPVTQ